MSMISLTALKTCRIKHVIGFGQLRDREAHLTACQLDITLVTGVPACSHSTPSYMLKICRVLYGMLGPNLKESGSRRWWAAIVLIAICSLALSVATRYTSIRTDSTASIIKIRKHVAPEPRRPRLLKTAATLMAPPIGRVMLQAPSSYPRIAPAGLPIPGVLLEEKLYNRPPPPSFLRLS